MRILFSGHPAHGHLTPMLPLATAALEAGHEVVVATGPDHARRLRDHGLGTWAVGPTFAQARALRLAAHPGIDGIAPAEQMAADIHALFGAASAQRVQQLGPLMRRWQPHLVVHGPVEFAAPVVAAALGIPRVVHGLGLTPVAPQRVLLEDASRPSIDRWGATISATALFDSTYLDLCPASLRIPGATPAFADSLALRPAVVSGPGPELALPDGVVHLTLGTVFHDAPHLLRECLRGLRELDIDVVLTLGPGLDPRILGEQPPRVHIAEYVPHDALLPRCRAVIHHGGAGTMFAAFAHALPQLILPQGADNFLNAAAAVRTGAALSLAPEAVTASAIADATARLLDDSRFRTAAVAVGRDIAEMPSAAEQLSTLISRVRC
ncbi:glycosyltransferase family 1 protein [Nocardia huaxiensis]|uniref:Glycosyltransferase family 1 protein n=1 Tax=Nocardia huaxiensis TaxID=2755382 RepID=A0A7D6V8K6_9NOCA|nr:glycosyltransferase [Nocardia huaxiensis]QLY28971.1 glycosyltransferase family 1 protein [Nocardia huaxiensis]